ncbi:hypothetical protein K7432_015619 [Basidiobolus ranarum]|uniref:Uncharacterized protein n=1 Tax=Basidiobolus ranarum TaxID=34480 RepID=A0ABR2WFU2_9FUNG
MHFTTSIFAGLTAFGFVSATVDFPYTYESSCVASCNEVAGKVCYADYTQDPNSPHFIESLSCLCDSSNPGHTAFMNSINTCMSNNCWFFNRDPFEDTTEGQMCAWYNKNKVTPKPTESKSTASNASSKSTETQKPTSTSESQPTGTKGAKYFPFKNPNKCVDNCSVEAGKKCWSHYTQDENSPYFVESFSCLCDSNNPGHDDFISDSGACVIEKCGIEAALKASSLETPICNWYNEHKVNTTTTGSSSAAHKSTVATTSSHKLTEVTSDSQKPTKATTESPNFY